MAGTRIVCRGAAALAAVTAALLFVGMVDGGDKTSSAGVKIGVPGTFFRGLSETRAQAMMAPFKVLLQSQTGLSGQVVVAPSPDALGQELSDGNLHFGVFHGFEFAWARQKHPDLKPVLIAINQHRELHANLLVRQDSKATSIADLEGKTAVMPKGGREHCLLFLERRCKDCGGKAEKYFAEVRSAADVEDALDEVVDGKADATVIDSIQLDWYKHRCPGRFAKLKVIQQSEPFPPTVVVYHPGGVQESILRRFQDGMLNASKERTGQTLLAMCKMTSFETIPSDYDQCLTDILKAYPPVEEGSK
jgi:ABC-type phosphate/phosphonate transport system substrate-binding protein